LLLSPQKPGNFFGDEGIYYLRFKKLQPQIPVQPTLKEYSLDEACLNNDAKPDEAKNGVRAKLWRSRTTEECGEHRETLACLRQVKRNDKINSIVAKNEVSAKF